MRRKDKSSGHPQYGQVLPLFALTVVAMFAIGALVVDLGFLFGQRRFDQNGADAAALAAGRRLASNVSPWDTSGNVFFAIAESEVYEIVRQYAGLDPDAYSSNDPTGTNQNAGLFGRNQLEVTLEYSVVPGQWCYSPSSGVQPPRSPAVPMCTLPTANIGGNVIAFPPQPVAPHPYRVRVTVSSTTGHFLAQVMAMITGSLPTTVPPPPSSDEVAACVAVPGAAGASESTTCAQAVVAVRGRSEVKNSAPLLPVTTGDCDVGPDSAGQLFQLWGSNPEGCGYNLNPWKNMLDFTEAESWCDDLSGGSTPNPDYKYEKLLPIGVDQSEFVRTSCAVGPDNWDRNGFEPGTYQSQLTGQTDHDIPFLIANGFGGWIRADYTDGNKMPTYVDANPAQGANLGQNIAVGFYCGSSGVSPTDCTVNPAGTYFFAQNQQGFQPICDDDYGEDFGLGCRDALIPAWGDDNEFPFSKGLDWAQNLNLGGNGWVHSGGGGPNRVRIVRLLNMRLYCAYSGPGLCTEPPKAVVGSAANSDVWGRFASQWEEGPCPECTGQPTIYGNVAVLER